VIEMKSLVLYASRYGNTQIIAEAVASVLQTRGEVRLLTIEEAPTPMPAGIDLLVIGGPTEVHGLTQPVAHFFNQRAPGELRGLITAAFDTRLHGPRLVTGSAATRIAHQLRRAGAHLIVPEESFLVHNRGGESHVAELDPGERERAEEWTAVLADKVAALAFTASLALG
jgi:flavodoxin